MHKLTSRSMFLLWLGASVSIAEICTGSLMAPLGMEKGLVIILAGHLIGCALMLAGGLMAFDRRENAMDTVRFAMGSQGVKLIAVCNVLQLIGWTLVMIVQGSTTLVSVFPGFSFRLGVIFLAVAIGLWALLFQRNRRNYNDVLVVSLSLLVLLLWGEVYFTATATPFQLSESISTILALELSIAMPVSWLPLVGDYALEADSRRTVTLGILGYGLGSILMYAFGLYITLQSGTDFFTAIAASRFKWIAAGVVLLSTITTAFLDLYSAAVSSQQIIKVRLPRLILLYAFLALGCAVIFPMNAYSSFLVAFLTAIGSIFVPVYIVVFLRKRFVKKPSSYAFDLSHLSLTALGVVFYHLASMIWPELPTTLLVIALLALLYTILFKRG